MGEREQMKLRELKEAAHALFVRGRFAQCADTYARILRLTPKDPNLHVRHAESCRRAGDRQGAIASYRAAAALLLEQGCESRARGALRAALELDPKDAMVFADLARLGQQQAPSTALEDERLYSGATGFVERPGAQGAVPPPPPPPYVLRAAEETPAPHPLPPMPTIPPVSLEAVRRAGGRAAPIPLVKAVGEGRLPPVVQGRLLTQPPVPPRMTPRAPGATMAPVPAASGTASGPMTVAPVMPYRPELRRLGPNAVAIRVSPQARWVVIRSESPLELSRAETLPTAEKQQPGNAAH